ncbi:MAG TPA: hypothetical protein VFN81_08735 [Sphingomicrobium sp.]|nr:hypothetical protein [Sphingomicrobium sp.]
MIRRLILLLTIAVLPVLTGCEGFKRLTDGATSTPPAAGAAADYTVSGTTAEDFEIVGVRTDDSEITIRVKRPGSLDWYVLDQFEFSILKGGVGGAVRFGYRNLYVGGVTGPVAPKGSLFEIRSVVKS